MSDGITEAYRNLKEIDLDNLPERTTILDEYYKTNHLLARAQARKLYRHLKAAVFKILQDEAKQAKGRDKIIGKKFIKMLKKKL